MNNIKPLADCLKNLVSGETLASDNPFRKALPCFIDSLEKNCSILRPGFSRFFPDKKSKSKENLSELYSFLDYALDICRDELSGIDFDFSGFSGDDLWRVFHPEAAEIRGREKEAEKELREKRKVHIEKHPEKLLTDTAGEVLFTSNILLTVPTEEMMREGLDISPGLFEKVKKIISMPQKYWYDHPIPLGIKKENNEIVYGLSRLNQAAAYEKKRGYKNINFKLTVLLSVSTTSRP